MIAVPVISMMYRQMGFDRITLMIHLVKDARRLLNDWNSWLNVPVVTYVVCVGTVSVWRNIVNDTQIMVLDWYKLNVIVGTNL